MGSINGVFNFFEKNSVFSNQMLLNGSVLAVMMTSTYAAISNIAGIDRALAQFQGNEWKRSGSMGDLYSDQDYAWKRSGQVGNLYADEDYNWKRSVEDYDDDMKRNW